MKATGLLAKASLLTCEMKFFITELCVICKML